MMKYIPWLLTNPTVQRRFILAIFLFASLLGAHMARARARPADSSSRPENPTAAQLDTLGARSSSLDSLEAKFGRNRLTRMLSDYVFVSGGRRVDPATMGPEGASIIESTAPYEKYSGDIIRFIAINRIDIFTGIDQDTTPQSEPWLYRAGNTIHVETRAGKIRSYLLFKEGDRLDPNELADSERILRNTPFIQDARIAVVRITEETDTVDVLVLTRDVWSIGVTASVSSQTRYKFKLYDRNLFGFGHSLQNEFDLDAERVQRMNYTLTYAIDNVYGSFMNGLFQYRNTHLDEAFRFGYSRGFISPQIHWAGALNISFSKLKDDFAVTTEKFKIQDIWIGRSFELGRRKDGPHSRRTFVVAGRSTRTNYDQHPMVPEGDRTFTDRTLYLWSLSLAKNNFRKGRLILGFGETEDVPYGYLLDVTFGHELARGVRDRQYAGVGLRAGGYRGKLGYLLADVEAGSYFLQRLSVDTVIDTRLGYFTNLIPLRRFALRQFVAAEYVVGLRRDDVIKLDDETGITGLSNVGLDGKERLTAGLQTVLFTPWSLFGFKTAVFGEATVGAVGPKYETIDDQRFYSSWGLGVRIDNERLVFDPIEIRVNFFPSPPDGEATVRFFFTSVRDFPILGFAAHAPSLVGFK